MLRIRDAEAKVSSSSTHAVRHPSVGARNFTPESAMIVVQVKAQGRHGAMIAEPRRWVVEGAGA